MSIIHPSTPSISEQNNRFSNTVPKITTNASKQVQSTGIILGDTDGQIARHAISYLAIVCVLPDCGTRFIGEADRDPWFRPAVSSNRVIETHVMLAGDESSLLSFRPIAGPPNDKTIVV